MGKGRKDGNTKPKEHDTRSSENSLGSKEQGELQSEPEGKGEMQASQEKALNKIKITSIDRNIAYKRHHTAQLSPRLSFGH